MQYLEESYGGITVLRLWGRFDAHNIDNVRTYMEKNTAVSQLVINLAGVNFVDSTALSTLVQGMKWMRQRGGDLHLAALQQPVHIIFELTRLDKAFPIFPDVAAAAEAFGTREPA